MCCGSLERVVPSRFSSRLWSSPRLLPRQAQQPARSVPRCGWSRGAALRPPALHLQHHVPGRAAPELSLVALEDFGPLLRFYRLCSSSGAEVEQLLG